MLRGMEQQLLFHSTEYSDALLKNNNLFKTMKRCIKSLLPNTGTSVICWNVPDSQQKQMI